MSLRDRFSSAWNAFTKEPVINMLNAGPGSSNPAHRTLPHRYSESSLANMVYNRIALDASAVDILHVKEDSKTMNHEKIQSGLQRCLSVETNIDQTGREFIHDVVFSMFDEGVVAIVPIDTDINPEADGGFNIRSMRVGKITQWYPRHVTIRVYNDRTGNDQDLMMAKDAVAIVENPLYAVMNMPNLTLKRLLRKLNLMDNIDDMSASDKLNLIIQLPYIVKSTTKREQAKQRMEALEEQLHNSKFGISYIDGSEKITQINRQIVNNIGEEAAKLQQDFYNQLGLTENVMNGTASEQEMRLYYNRTIDPIIERILLEMSRKFFTKTAQTQGQKLIAYRDPFKLVPVEQLADIADTFTRNAILTPNEVRAIVGFGPNSQPDADQLINRNIAEKNQSPSAKQIAKKIESNSTQNNNNGG